VGGNWVRAGRPPIAAHHSPGTHIASEIVRQRNSAATSSVHLARLSAGLIFARSTGTAAGNGCPVAVIEFHSRARSSGFKPEQQPNPPTSYAKRRLLHPPSNHPAPFGDCLACGFGRPSPDHETPAGKLERGHGRALQRRHHGPLASDGAARLAALSDPRYAFEEPASRLRVSGRCAWGILFPRNSYKQESRLQKPRASPVQSARPTPPFHRNLQSRPEAGPSKGRRRT